ncbi:hypothetical protein [Domibacillus iocasae]|uniref:Uncharacterized protein n=1 Tax=Domibacillus iocasae TaxID=1714016 RepID=A0A1E7DNJ9_9BACI|nr:hypothetical protein [Domibacillus iocasae]OES44575.1 hypothetical protein BA724_09920 [Domibacillus iocasae]
MHKIPDKIDKMDELKLDTDWIELIQLAARNMNILIEDTTAFLSSGKIQSEGILSDEDPFV